MFTSADTSSELIERLVARKDKLEIQYTLAVDQFKLYPVEYTALKSELEELKVKYERENGSGGLASELEALKLKYEGEDGSGGLASELRALKLKYEGEDGSGGLMSELEALRSRSNELEGLKLKSKSEEFEALKAQYHGADGKGGLVAEHAALKEKYEGKGGLAAELDSHKKTYEDVRLKYNNLVVKYNGKDGKGGLVADLTSSRSEVSDMQKKLKDVEKERDDWRSEADSCAEVELDVYEHIRGFIQAEAEASGDPRFATADSNFWDYSTAENGDRGVSLRAVKLITRQYGEQKLLIDKWRIKWEEDCRKLAGERDWWQEKVGKAVEKVNAGRNEVAKLVKFINEELAPET
ncbi:hypothetical protein BDV95DRAFT_277367 [Massariosphaeria phaeospora]|uniref:Uncharacterized protein n=1 Tax=Massariosphaeria phaeospora TaxID=100035 RepID=A0A7C8IF09_9PLEO|nr:hypothetical protein BDV95DRAFT_277367 [Massariosphaeria phaeospora]